MTLKPSSIGFKHGLLFVKSFRALKVKACVQSTSHQNIKIYFAPQKMFPLKECDCSHLGISIGGGHY